MDLHLGFAPAGSLNAPLACFSRGMAIWPMGKSGSGPLHGTELPSPTALGRKDFKPEVSLVWDVRTSDRCIRQVYASSGVFVTAGARIELQVEGLPSSIY